jgi:MSHA biogenesis protein MshN
MSVINQMLNGLEQRGVQATSEQVRPVHAVRDTRKIKFMLLAALLAVLTIFAAVKYGAAKPLPPVVVVAAELLPVKEPAKKKVYKKPEQHVDAPEKKSHSANSPATEKKPVPVAHQEKVPDRVVERPVHVATIAPPLKQISVAQQADGEFRHATEFMRQGHNAEAQSGFESALKLDAGHEAARQSLVALLLEGKRNAEAEQVLEDGLKKKPGNSGFAMMLARLQVQRNELDQAITTLEATLPNASQLSDYQAFYAALLQRKARHKEALLHYQIALKAAPNTGIWLMGYAISLQALSQTTEAKEAYQRALDSKSLSPELQAFVQNKISTL